MARRRINNRSAKRSHACYIRSFRKIGKVKKIGTPPPHQKFREKTLDYIKYTALAGTLNPVNNIVTKLLCFGANSFSQYQYVKMP